MKKDSPTFWFLKRFIPSVIVTVTLVYAAASFIRIRDMWVAQCLIVLAILSFSVLCVTSYLFACSMINDASEDLKTALNNGMKRSVIAWFFVSLAIGIAAAFACISLGMSISNSLVTGITIFLIFAFAPTLVKRKLSRGKEMKKEKQEGRKPQENTDAEIGADRGKTNELPTNFPKELNHYAIRVLFHELEEAQIVDKDYRPINLTKTQMALLGDAISTIFSIRNKWQVFEPFWGQKDMKQTLAQALRNDTQLSLSIYQVFKKAQDDPRVGAIRTLTEWTERYRKKYLH